MSFMDRNDCFLEAYMARIVETQVAPPHRRIFHLDYETYSEANLPKTGASVYARHETTEILMLAYGWSDGEIKQWVPSTGEPMPDDLKAALRDPFVTLAAWNAPFEMAITEHTLGWHIPVERWLDVMALSFSLSLPGKLSTCGKVIGLPEDKQKLGRGTALITRFCKPRKPSKFKPWTRATADTDPAEWQEFLEYNIQDVEAERQIYRRLKRYQMPDHEWKLWHLDQKINNAGIPINLEAVKKAYAIAVETIDRDLAEMRELTGLANPNSNVQILPWLRENGYQFLDLKKGHIERAHAQVKAEHEAGIAELLGVGPDLLRVLELRLRVSKASIKKLPALLMATDADGGLRGCHQFAGAGRTWRWSGRRFQPQNLPKPAYYLEGKEAELVADILEMDADEIEEKWGNPMEVLTAIIRPMVQAGRDKMLVDADLSAIENVVLGWLANDEKILRVFWDGLDPYVDFAVDMFNLPYEVIAARVAAGDKKMRTTAKPGVLGCGYMLGKGEARENKQTGEVEATGLLGYAWNMGVDLTPEMAALSVDTFRNKFKKVKSFWYDLEGAARRVIQTKKPEVVGYLRLDMKGPFMRIELPSGRHLHYMRPKLIKKMMPWGKIKLQITYQNMENGQWRRVSTHPGKLTENVTQAVARDILAHGMTLSDAAGIDIRMHVHDQIIGLAPEEEAEAQKDLMIELMTTLPDWADDKLPLKAAGLTTKIFIKD